MEVLPLQWQSGIQSRGCADLTSRHGLGLWFGRKMARSREVERAQRSEPGGLQLDSWNTNMLFTPFGWRHVKAFFEADVEQTQMIEPALFSDDQHFGIGIAQQCYRFHHAQFHPQRGDRKAEPVLKNAAQMPAAAMEPARKFLDRHCQKLIG